MTPQILKQTLRKYAGDKDRDPRLAFGVRTESPWTGESEINLNDDGGAVRVVACRSMLEMRQALTELSPPLALLTSLDDKDLASDLRARLYRQRLIEVDVWELVGDRFKARSVESRLRRDRALAQRVLSWLDGRQPPALPAGVLSETALWTFVLRETVDPKVEERPDIAQLLAWRSDPSKWRSLTALPSELWAGLSDWVKRSLGDGVAFVLDNALEVPPLVVATALLALRDDPRAADRAEWGLARGRFEKFLGNHALTPDLIREYTVAAETILRSRPLDDILPVVRRADDVLEQIEAVRFATRSGWSQAGARQLLDRIASDLDNPDLLCQIERSFLRYEPESIERIRMAARLERWLARPESTSSNVTQAAKAYLDEQSWVDWARSSLRNVATDSAELNRSIAQLCARSAERRDTFNQKFARLLSAETRVSHSIPGLLGVENILETVVRPLLARRRVLLLVMDGMSLPILRELSRELGDRRWIEFQQAGQIAVAVSVLPSVTQLSRCSLLSGALVSGGQQAEERNFTAKFPDATLFHKNDLVNFANSEVAREIGREDRKLVAVVVNAVDDFLSGSEQTTESWSLKRLSILQAILAEAELADRVVVLTSDHGHIIEHGTSRIAQTETSDRWREGKPEADGEIAVAGPRVLAAKSVVCLASERVRYALKPHNGYHGGLTPQECLVPVAILARSEHNLEGWSESVSQQPAWWTQSESVPAPPARVRTKAPKPQPGLFEQTKHWTDELLESEQFQAQIALTGGHVKPDQVSKLLRVLDAAPGNKLLKQAFASQMQLNVFRVGQIVSIMQRVLNFDSYPVLTLDDTSGYVILEKQLLLKQFEIS